jgi:hypothetical protein
MWDPTKFYDDLEQSVFKIMLTCGIDVYDVFSELTASQNNMEQGTPDYSVNRNDENYFVTNFARK